MRIIILTLLLLCIFYSFLYAAGLSTSFSEVILENLEIGKTYSTEKTANLPLEVVNTGKQPVDLTIEILVPQPQELKENYEPIPDVSWIKVKKADFKNIPANASAITDVLVSIPNDTEYQGKNYQVYVWAHTVGKAIGIGLKSRLLIKVKNEKS